MQFEEFDKKVREAADHHHPSYDEGAWAGMEKMLDKHLPQKKDNRRRFILFLLLFLLAGGGAAFLFFNRLQQHRPSIINEQGQLEKNSSTDKTVTIISDKIKKDNTSLESENRSGILPNQKELTQTPYKIVLVSPDKYAYRNIFTNKTNVENKINSISKNNRTDDFEHSIPDKNIAERNVEKRTESIIPDVSNNSPVQRNNTSEKVVDTMDTHTEGAIQYKQEDNADKEKSAIIKQVVQNKKGNNKKNSFFFASLSAAPDVSAAGSDKAGKLKLSIGAGLGYTFHDKLTIRTGFYSSRKIYSASPGEYHPPASFWNYYPDLENVDADCKVYEIPLLLGYNFGNSSKQNWFGTAGLSSYLMKRETYNYTYKDFSGQYRNTSRTIYDKNKHYFSVLTLSAGYQRKISNTFFFTAEPYVKIPLTGVGYGKVKLNSAGVLFSLGIKPFNTNKRITKVIPAGNN